MESGSGEIITCISSTGQITFSSLASKYPLKLVSPPRPISAQKDLGTVFVMTYGGGVVGNDSITLSVTVGTGSRLALLTQGSTKVFKSKGSGGNSCQTLKYTVEKHATLFILPAPTTLFSAASFIQSQIVKLMDRSSSVCLLDWYTSGRSLAKVNESWSFNLFNSFVNIHHNTSSQPIIHDNLVLSSASSFHSLQSRLDPYTCYASLYLIGPRFITLGEKIHANFNHHSRILYNLKQPLDLVWSATLIKEGEDILGVTVRAASKGTERMRDWLRGDELGMGKELEETLGQSNWRHAMA